MRAAALGAPLGSRASHRAGSAAPRADTPGWSRLRALQCPHRRATRSESPAAIPAARTRIEVQPLHAVVHLEQHFGLHRPGPVRSDTPCATRAGICAPASKTVASCARWPACCPCEEQTDVLIALTGIDPPQQLRGEARDIGRLSTHIGDEPFHRDARRFIELRAVPETAASCLRRFAANPYRRAHGSRGLPAARLSHRPLRFTARRNVARRQPEAARHEILIEQREAGREAGNPQRRLDGRRTRVECTPPLRSSRLAVCSSGTSGKPSTRTL